MHAANSIHAGAGSLERPSREKVLAPKVRPHPRHSQRWPEESRPFRTKAGQPHLGHRSGSPQAEAARSSAMALLQHLGQLALIGERHRRDLVHDPHGGSFPSCFFDDRIVGQRTRFAYPGIGTMSMLV